MTANNDNISANVGEGASNVAAGKDLYQANISDVTTESGDVVAGDKHVYITPAAQESLTPFGKLLASIPDAISTLYEPTRIKKKAQAEADAAVILSQSRIEIQEREYRAFQRVRDNEVRRQRNIEAITEKAINALPSSVSPQPVDEDWVYDFYQRSQDISDEQMQEYWARILAGEVAQPGSFSRRTLETVKTLSANEARLFANCCRFVWNGEDAKDELLPIILDIEHAVPVHFYTQVGLDFTGLQILQAAGLIVHGNFAIRHLGNQYHIKYFGSQYKLSLYEYRGSEPRIYVIHGGHVLFTEAGKELWRIVKAEPDREYEQSILEYWKKLRIEIEKVDS